MHSLRTRAISQPVQISPTLLRFNIAQFASQKDDFIAWLAAWEKLAEGDPYFHLRTEVLAKAEGGKGKADGTNAENHGSPTASRSAFRVPNSALKTVTTDGGWVDLSAAARLRAASGSNGALLRADYFVAQATIAPRYYEFAGVPETENEFLKSFGVDQTAIDRLRANAGANLIISGVTAKPRRVVWAQGPLGGVYSTLDVAQVDAERDPLRRPISAAGFAFRYDVSEWFVVAPNGLWRTALFDAAGKRQNSVPDKVAKDTSDPLGDGIVVPLVSCIRCHQEAGLRPFSDDQTKLLAGRVDLLSHDPNIVQRAAEFYDEPRLQRQMRFDRETYTAACRLATTLSGATGSASVPGDDRIDSALAQSTGKASGTQRASGMTPEQLAVALAAAVRKFSYLPVTPEQAAVEVGLPLDQFKLALAATHDPVILILLEGRSVLRGQWESSFAEAALAATNSPQRHGD